MPRNFKRTRPGGGRPGFPAALRLVGREPLLVEAARIEAGLADLYRRLAERTHGGAEGPGWRKAWRLTREVADGLTALATAVADPPHNPRPTRIRTATLHGDDLAAAAAGVAALAGALDRNRAGGRTPVAALKDLCAVEGRAVVAPLTRLFALCPCGPVTAIWHALAARRRVLDDLGVGAAAGAAPWPDPPGDDGAPRPLRAAGAARAAEAREWTAPGHVLSLDPVRRCGTARTDDGRAVFFPARAVPGGLEGLAPGAAVTLCVRRGPLGLAALRVTPRPDPGPTAPAA